LSIKVAVLVCPDWFRFRGVRRKDMLAYSTTNTPEDGPIRPNPERTWPIFPLDVTLSSLKGATLQRYSKLARSKMGRASTTILILNRS
jgi:hypothetical protein